MELWGALGWDNEVCQSILKIGTTSLDRRSWLWCGVKARASGREVKTEHSVSRGPKRWSTEFEGGLR